MEVYQLIYTAVRYSLSDSTLNLENKPGYRVYSCTQGITKEEIEEIICFCGYKKPDNTDIKYSKEFADPEIPEKFPKTFRTFKLTTDKYVAVQTVFSGYDDDGQDTNFFAHAFIFDDVDDDFCPEMYYGSESFRTHLTEEEKNLSLVRYLPKLKEIKIQENLSQWVELFAKEHKTQMSALIDSAVEILIGESSKTHLCISANTEEESDYYLLALKQLLPDSLAKMSGISTNNTYLPSEKQNLILFNATVSGFNNINEELIEQRKHCIYIDFEKEEFSGVYERLFEMNSENLMSEYERLGIDIPQKFNAWLLAYNRVNEKGISKRLQMIRDIDSSMFKERCLELYSQLNNPEMSMVKVEILSVMNDNLSDFSEKADDILKEYLISGFSGIASGEPVNMEGIFKSYTGEELKLYAQKAYNYLDEIMTILSSAEINEQQAMLALRMFAIIKQAAEISDWKTFFGNKREYMEIFVDFSAQVIINDATPVTFIAPIIWTNAELAEVVAYFDSSTDDEEIKKGCRKFILNNIREDWKSYGITITKEEKSREEREKDIMLVRKMLSSVGYVPFQRGKYQDLKFDVVNDMEKNDNPLLITRLLYAYYNWQMTDLSSEAKQYVKEMSDLILEMKEKANSCYKFMLPKFALEMLSVSGLYYEEVINCNTMSDTFWNWFLIGANKNKKDEFVFANYEQVFRKNEKDLRHLAIYMRLKKVFN